jgi:voltage-gated potassium channel
VQGAVEREKSKSGWRQALYKIVFENDTIGGKAFDVCLLIVILLSVIVVILDSIESVRSRHSNLFITAEWAFTFLFTVEYGLRIACAENRRKYAFSFFGIIDLIAVLPTYIGLFIGGAHYLMVVRILRLLRIFRIFKLSRHLTEAEVLGRALLNSRAKITVFIGTVLTLVIVIGALMYIVEGPQNGFTDIPLSIYWAIVTLTTVGYGDIAPKTPFGQFLACCVMILGYGILAVPTGIVSVELQAASRQRAPKAVCPRCHRRRHDTDAKFCKNCGTALIDTAAASIR